MRIHINDVGTNKKTNLFSILFSSVSLFNIFFEQNRKRVKNSFIIFLPKQNSPQLSVILLMASFVRFWTTCVGVGKGIQEPVQSFLPSFCSNQCVCIVYVGLLQLSFDRSLYSLCIFTLFISFLSLTLSLLPFFLFLCFPCIFYSLFLSLPIFHSSLSFDRSLFSLLYLSFVCSLPLSFSITPTLCMSSGQTRRLGMNLLTSELRHQANHMTRPRALCHEEHAVKDECTFVRYSDNKCERQNFLK